MIIQCPHCLRLNTYNPRKMNIFGRKRCIQCGRHFKAKTDDIIQTEIIDEPERITKFQQRILELADFNPSINMALIERDTHESNRTIYHSLRRLTKLGLLIEHKHVHDRRHKFYTRSNKPIPDVDLVFGQARLHNVKLTGKIINRPQTMANINFPSNVIDYKEYPMTGWRDKRVILYVQDKIFSNIEVNQDTLVVNLTYPILTHDIDRTLLNLYENELPRILSILRQLGIRIQNHFKTSGHAAFKGFTLDLPPDWWTDKSEGQREAETDKLDKAEEFQKFCKIFDRMLNYFKKHFGHRSRSEFKAIVKLKLRGQLNVAELKDRVMAMSCYSEFEQMPDTGGEES